MGYKHLTREQRYTIEALLQTPMSLREIGEVIGVSKVALQDKIHTITADNGKEFARHKEIAEIEWKLNSRPRKSLGI